MEKEINWKVTKVFDEVLRAFLGGKRRVLLEGGTSSSKTFSFIQALIYIAKEIPKPVLISVVSESLPHLKRGCIRDFFNILEDTPEGSPYWSRTEFTYRRPDWNGSFEFFGADDQGKVRGPRRGILAINEANNVPWETARQLDVRTELFTIADWNPVGEFWADEYWMGSPENAYSHSTYLDAKAVLPRQTVDVIESYKDKDPNWWNVYGLGQLGKVENLVHPYFKQIDELPDGDYFYGLDFGFGSYSPDELLGGDPTVLTRHCIIGDNLYSEQVFYERKAMTNDDIARAMELSNVNRNSPIYPDPNEPKSAEELRKKGFNIRATEKGAGSVAFGIKRVNQFYQHWTKDSTDCIKDQRNYKYIKKREPNTGREYLSDDTTHQWSHGMDSRRYAVATYGGQGLILPQGVSRRLNIGRNSINKRTGLPMSKGRR